MTLRRGAASILFLALALVLVLAGCGGGDDEASDTTAAATEATTDSSGAGGGTTLNGSVGPGFDISLDGTDGLTAGDYTLSVDDQSSPHNFHLTGPGGVDVSTGVRRGAESVRHHAQPGRVQVRLRPAREPDARQLHCRLSQAVSGALPITFMCR